MFCGAMLEQLIKEQGLSNYRLSKIIGCSQTSIANWISGKNAPSYEKISDLADALGVSVEYLQGSEKKPTISQDGGQKDVKDILLDVKSKAAQGITLMYNGKPINERTMRAFEASLEAAITLLDASQEE